MRHLRKPVSILAILLLMLTFVGCGLEEPAKAEDGKNVTIEITDIEGEQLILLETTTQAEVLSEILLENDLIDYDETGLGKFITGMAGVIADPDSEYWAIYVNGEYGLYGADNQKVSDGDSFLFEMEKY